MLDIFNVVDANLVLTLQVFTATIVILLASLVCGKLALLIGQPRVLGEMVAGVLLGPSLFGLFLPGLQETIFSPDVKSILYVMSTIGLTLFMFLVGAGLDHGGSGSEKLVGKAAVLAVSGMLGPFVLGAGVAWLFYEQLASSDVSMWKFLFFCGGALSLTAFPMLARILYERRIQDSRIGRLSLLGASMDDAAAWCFLAVLSALHLGAGFGHALMTIGLTLGFALFMLVFVARMLKPLGERVARTGELGPNQFYLVILIVLTSGFFTDLIGIYSVFGGFIAGLAMPRNTALREILHTRMMSFVSVLLLPMFFAYSGLNTQLGELFGWTLLAPFLALLLAGFVGKYFGCALTLRLVGFSWRESYAVGSLMNARGLMILIFINIGLSQGLITQDLFSIFVMIAIVTTASAMPLYRLALPSHVEREVLGQGRVKVGE